MYVVIGAVFRIWPSGHAEEYGIFVPEPLIQARGVGGKEGELLTFHAAERSWVSLVPGARF